MSSLSSCHHLIIKSTMDSDTESSMICLLTSGALDYRYIQSFETPWAYFQNIQILEICFFFFWKRDRCNISKTRSTKFSVFISVAIILLGCFKVNCYNWRFMYLYNLIVMYIWSGFTNLTIFLLGGLKVNCYN